MALRTCALRGIKTSSNKFVALDSATRPHLRGLELIVTWRGDANSTLNAWPRDQNVLEHSIMRRSSWIELDFQCVLLTA